ncbi:MAG: hydrogenase iron-sulfur subunit [Candidatus Desulforudis sp.]|nr:hydrogenase iron-sulfur subunit [Desulforudis sp.]
MRRYQLMKKVLEQLGVEDQRVRLEWISSAEGTKFAKVIEEFTEQVRQLGPFKQDQKTAAGGEG